MKESTIFENEVTGQRFNSKIEAVASEKKSLAILKIFSFFKKEPKDRNCSFANGKWCYQRTENEYLKLKDSIIKSVEKYENWIFKQYEKDGGLQRKHIGSGFMIGRYLSDNNSDIYKYYCLMSDICPKCFRQWGQPYFSNNCKCSETKEETRIIKGLYYKRKRLFQR